MLYNVKNVRTASPPVKRILTMNHYKKLVHYIDDLILDKAKRTSDGFILSINDLDSDELGDITALYLEYNDRDTSDCFQDENITSSLLKLLQNDSVDNKEDFATIIRNSTIQQYELQIEHLIQERCAEIEIERDIENGFYQPPLNRRQYA